MVSPLVLRLFIAGVLLLGGGVFLTNLDLPTADKAENGSPQTNPKTIPVSPAGHLLSVPPVDLDKKYRELLVGQWEQEYYGTRLLTVNEDGTAVLKYYAEGLVRKGIYGDELIVYFNWSVEDGVISLESTGGKPAAKIQLAEGIYGKTREQTISELDEDQMILLNPEGKPDPVWKRISSES